MLQHHCDHSKSTVICVCSFDIVVLFVGTHGSSVERLMRRDAVPVYFPVCSDAVS